MEGQRCESRTVDMMPKNRHCKYPAQDREPRPLRAKTSNGLLAFRMQGRTVWRLLQLSKRTVSCCEARAYRKTSRNEEEEERCSSPLCERAMLKNRFFN